MNALQLFLCDRCFYVPGAAVPFKTFYERFIESLPQYLRGEWSPNRTARELPSQFPRGRVRGSVARHIGNLSFEPSEPVGPPYHRDVKGYLSTELTDQ